MFRPTQKRFDNIVTVKINNKLIIKQEPYVKYLGIITDSRLNWKKKTSTSFLPKKKNSRAVGIISKIRYFVPIDIFLHLYHSLVNPFLNIGS